MRAIVPTVLSAFAAITAPYAAEARIQKFELNIPREGLDAALSELSRVTGVQIARMSDEGPAVGQVGPLQGEFDTKAALSTLLQGTALEFEFVSDRLVKVYLPRSVSSSLATALFSSEESSGADESKNPVPEENAKAEESWGSEDRLALALKRAEGKTAATQSEEASSPGAGDDGRVALEEIVVSAQKRGEERLRDIPVPVTVLNAEQLIERNQLRLRDYVASIPGVNIGSAAVGFQFVSIRGITTGLGNSNPKVGILIDDVPIGASTARGGGNFVPDIDPNDLARIEVLRGPQGTLYGAGSLGGLINYITLDPSTDGVRARVQTGFSSVRNGSGTGYNVRGSVNVPLSDTFAFIASGFTREEPGFIDNALTGERAFNDQRVSGGRLSALWKPSDAFSLKLGAVYQSYKGDGPTELPATSIGDLETVYLRGVGDYKKELQLYSATVKADLGRVDLTSITAYSTFKPFTSQDYSGVALWSNLSLSNFGVSGVSAGNGRDLSKFTQELRLSGSAWQRVDWILGGLYAREDAEQFDPFRAVDPSTGQLLGAIYDDFIPSNFEEYAAFANLTYHFTDRFNVQLGGRQSHIRHDVQNTVTGPYVSQVVHAIPPLISPHVRIKADAFTYLVTPQLKVTADLMLYARVASGYGAGGANPVVGVPQEFDSESTRNYELGLKAEFLENRLSVDASIYRINYNDLQLSVRLPSTGVNYAGNGGRAKSEGVELSVIVRPTAGLTMNGWFTYDDAKLTEAIPPGPTYGVSGDRLPLSSRVSGYLSLDQELPISEGWLGSIGVATSFVGERLGVFAGSATTPRAVYPSYTKTDVHASIKWDAWTASLYVDNITDRRGILSGDNRGTTPVLFPIQPRTIGVSLAKGF